MFSKPPEQRVHEVFDLRPRVRHKDALWVDRTAAARRLAELFVRVPHICLDGPTGVGKTSLVLTHFALKRIPHVAVQMTSSMDWPAFCRRLLVHQSDREYSLGGTFELGFTGLQPVMKGAATFQARDKPSDDLHLLTAMARSWIEQDVADWLVSKDLTLMIDDVERADGRLIRQLADLCKVLTHTAARHHATLIFVGSDDIYQRLYSENTSLSDRLSRLTLGGLGSFNDSVELLRRGFDLLNLRHPWQADARDGDQAGRCTLAVWEAADSLPKSLNNLGRAIALHALSDGRVDHRHIIDESRKMFNERLTQVSYRWPQLLDCLSRDELAIEALRAIYLSGVAQVHEVNGLKENLRSDLSHLDDGSLEATLDKLIALDFLRRAGPSGGTVMVSDPTAAHTLWVVMRHADRFLHLLGPGFDAKQLRRAFPGPTHDPDEGLAIDA